MVTITVVEMKIEDKNKDKVFVELRKKADVSIEPKKKETVPQAKKKVVVRITTTSLGSFKVPFDTMKDAEKFEADCFADGMKGFIEFKDETGREVMLRQKCIETLSINKEVKTE